MQLERDALNVLREGWTGESAAAAVEFIDAHCQEGQALVSALRHAAELLAAVGDLSVGDLSVGDPSIGMTDEAQTRLDERPPSNFASSMPPVAPPSAPPMNWPAAPMPALPDFGGAISALIAEAADAINGDPATPADTPARDTPASAAKNVPSVASPAAVPVFPPPATPTAAPAAAAPLLAAEMPPPQPVAAPPAEVVPDRTPCEIAADELPQVGE